MQQEASSRNSFACVDFLCRKQGISESTQNVVLSQETAWTVLEDNVHAVKLRKHLADCMINEWMNERASI